MRKAVVFLWVAVGILADYNLGAVFSVVTDERSALAKNHQSCEKVCDHCPNRLLCRGLQCFKKQNKACMKCNSHT